MTKVEIEEQRAILKQLHYRDENSINELTNFVSNLIELMHQNSTSPRVRIYSADLRLQLEMMRQNQINTKGIFLKYKHAAVKEINSKYFDNLISAPDFSLVRA
jgi:hypothetical protein